MDKAARTLSDIKSIKSIDLNAKTYQSASKLRSKLKGYIDDLAKFNGTSYKGVEWSVQPGTSRTLEIAIPSSPMTNSQLKIFNEMMEYARKKGITIIKTIID